MKVKAVYTNKAPGGVAYRCSFRITEAVYLVERMVDALALEMKVDPIDLRMRSFIEHGPVPVRDDDRLDVRLRRLPQDDAGRDGHRGLRGPAPRAGREARARRADGHRRLVLHRGRRRRPAQAHGHPRAVDERRRRPARAPVRARPSVASARRPRARATRRRSRRSSPRSSASRPRTSRSATATPTSRRTGSAPTAAAPRRCPAPRSRSSRARSATRRARSPRTMLETRPEDLAWEKGRWYVKGDPEQGASIDDIAAARLQRRVDARGHGGRPRRAGHLRPAEPHLPLRRLHRGRRRRPRDRARDGPALHRGRRLRRADQPDDRRRARSTAGSPRASGSR